jgi:hypothetical protein
MVKKYYPSDFSQQDIYGLELPLKYFVSAASKNEELKNISGTVVHRTFLTVHSYVHVPEQNSGDLCRFSLKKENTVVQTRSSIWIYLLICKQCSFSDASRSDAHADLTLAINAIWI